uniref:Uncharacterized protein n=1 Tax=Solanum lycopersicum TaxID=4081 RepID=A0A3Q7H690_SOLLC
MTYGIGIVQHSALISFSPQIIAAVLDSGEKSSLFSSSHRLLTLLSLSNFFQSRISSTDMNFDSQTGIMLSFEIMQLQWQVVHTISTSSIVSLLLQFSFVNICGYIVEEDRSSYKQSCTTRSKVDISFDQYFVVVDLLCLLDEMSDLYNYNYRGAIILKSQLLVLFNEYFYIVLELSAPIIMSYRHSKVVSIVALLALIISFPLWFAQSIEASGACGASPSSRLDIGESETLLPTI